MKVMLSGLGFVDVTVNTDCGYENRLMRAAIKDEETGWKKRDN